MVEYISIQKITSNRSNIQKESWSQQHGDLPELVHETEKEGHSNSYMKISVFLTRDKFPFGEKILVNFMKDKIIYQMFYLHSGLHKYTLGLPSM